MRTRRRCGGRGDSVGAEDGSERPVGRFEEFELCFVAEGFVVELSFEILVVVLDLSEVLVVEGDGEVVEEFGDVSGGLVAEFIGHEEAGEVIGAVPRRRAGGARG